MPSSDYRMSIVLPATERAIADAIAERIGAGYGGRSMAIRYALRETAVRMGIPLPVADLRATKKKKS